MARGRKKPATKVVDRTDAKRAKLQARADGYSNAVSGLATAVDPHTYTRHYSRILSSDEARDLWRTNGIAAKIIELRPKNVFRRGFKISMDDAELGAALLNELEEIPCGETRGIRAAFRQAGYFENGYGGGAIYPVINDGAALDTPLVTKGRMRRIECFQLLEPRELQPHSWYRSFGEPKFGRPRLWRINARSRGGMSKGNLLIHESRLVIFPGIMLERDQDSAEHGWGDSRLNRANEALEACGVTWQGVASLMHRIEQGVLKVADLASTMQSDEGALVTDAFHNLNKLRSIMKMIVIDGEDSYERHGVPLAGISDVIQEFKSWLAGVAEIPVSKLFSANPGSGLNTTGDEANQDWDDSVEAEQNDHFGPRVEQVVRLHMLCTESAAGGVEPESWSIKWNKLRQMTELQQAELQDRQADADQKYKDMGVLTNTIIRRNRFANGEFSTSTTITDDELAELEELDKAPPEPPMASEDQPVEGVPAPEDPEDPKDPEDPEDKVEPEPESKEG